MTLFIISIPLMLVAVAIAVVPLIAMSKSEARKIAIDVERLVERERLAYQAHHARKLHIHDEHPSDSSLQAPLNGIDSQQSRPPVLVGEA